MQPNQDPNEEIITTEETTSAVGHNEAKATVAVPQVVQFYKDGTHKVIDLAEPETIYSLSLANNSAPTIVKVIFSTRAIDVQQAIDSFRKEMGIQAEATDDGRVL